MEHVSYTEEWGSDFTSRFFREVVRCIAFGVLMFFSLVFLFGVFLLTDISTENIENVDRYELFINERGSKTSSPNGTAAVMVFLFVGLFIGILCWRGVSEVEYERHWEESAPTIWDDQQARWIEHTIGRARYRESKDKITDKSLVLSDDIYAATHKLIDDVDESTDRLLLESGLLNPPEEDILEPLHPPEEDILEPLHPPEEDILEPLHPPEKKDTFQYKYYYSLVAKRRRIMWDYKDKKGILHSGVVDSIDEALEKAKKFGYQPDEKIENSAKRD